MQRRLALVLALFVSYVALAQTAPLPVEPLTAELACRWSAQLTAANPAVRDSYAVPFELLIEHAHGGLRAALLNGSDRMEFSSAVQQGGEVTLRLDQYDATLTAHCTSGAGACEALEGEYVRQRGASLSRSVFSAKCARPASDSEPLAPIGSDWQFVFADSAGKPGSGAKEPAHFAQEGKHVEGTIAPISGDYGMLSGEIGGNELHLSRFDGVHALRLDGHYVFADQIEGVFHVAPGSARNFVATRVAANPAGFEEAEHLTTVENPTAPFRFHGVDGAGATITQDDPAFRGKVVLVDIFGTWCPNCHDEAPLLQSLYAKFHARGFEVVGLSYEYVDDRARSMRLIDIYRRKYSITFPLLLAGTTDAGQIEKTLPQLRNFGAYPTTIFIDRRGHVRLIHAGFSGPATGRMEEVRQSFERTIVNLLNEP